MKLLVIGRVDPGFLTPVKVSVYAVPLEHPDEQISLRVIYYMNPDAWFTGESIA